MPGESRPRIDAMVIEVEGRDLPGRSCNPGPDTGRYENVHVGIGPREDPAELFPGDAPSASWRFEVKPTRGTDGSIDFRGPLVAGRRGDRFLYLNWGTVGENGAFKLFRRAKIGLSELDPSLVEQALDQQAGLRCTIHLTDAKGNPICARLRPPAIEWQVV
jgi:hypothetical protein